MNKVISGPGLMGCGGDGGGGVISGDMISRKLVVPLVGAVVGRRKRGFIFFYFQE